MIAAIIQARMGSTRLPGKIMKRLSGREVLWHVVERVRNARCIDCVAVATTTNPEDDVVEAFCAAHQISFYRGSAENVLDRYYETAKKMNADVIIRITADCPLIDPHIIDLCVDSFVKSPCDYMSNAVPGPRTFPRGLDTEVFSFGALEGAHLNASEAYEREHVTPHIWENKKNEFIIGEMLKAPSEYAGTYRLTVDYPEDFELIDKIYQNFYQPHMIVNVPKVINFLDKNPDIVRINAHCEQKPLY